MTTILYDAHKGVTTTNANLKDTQYELLFIQSRPSILGLLSEGWIGPNLWGITSITVLSSEVIEQCRSQYVDLIDDTIEEQRAKLMRTRSRVKIMQDMISFFLQRSLKNGFSRVYTFTWISPKIMEKGGWIQCNQEVTLNRKMYNKAQRWFGNRREYLLWTKTP